MIVTLILKNYHFSLLLFFVILTDLRDIKSRLSWIQPHEIDLTTKIGKTVTGEVITKIQHLNLVIN